MADLTPTRSFSIKKIRNLLANSQVHLEDASQKVIFAGRRFDAAYDSGFWRALVLLEANRLVGVSCCRRLRPIPPGLTTVRPFRAHIEFAVQRAVASGQGPGLRAEASVNLSPCHRPAPPTAGDGCRKFADRVTRSNQLATWLTKTERRDC